MSARADIRLPFGYTGGLDHAWHVELNRYDAPHTRPESVHGYAPDRDGKSFMYEAKSVAAEIPRLALLFGMERRGELAQRHRQCSRDHDGEEVVDNHLTCCLGIACRACPHLAVIDRVTTVKDYSVRPSIEVRVPDEQRDVMKAWTCATHILMRGGDTAREGYILTTDDQMYWSNLYESLAAGPPAEEDAEADELELLPPEPPRRQEGGVRAPVPSVRDLELISGLTAEQRRAVARIVISVTRDVFHRHGDENGRVTVDRFWGHGSGSTVNFVDALREAGFDGHGVTP